MLVLITFVLRIDRKLLEFIRGRDVVFDPIWITGPLEGWVPDGVFFFIETVNRRHFGGREFKVGDGGIFNHSTGVRGLREDDDFVLVDPAEDYLGGRFVVGGGNVLDYRIGK